MCVAVGGGAVAVAVGRGCELGRVEGTVVALGPEVLTVAVTDAVAVAVTVVAAVTAAVDVVTWSVTRSVVAGSTSLCCLKLASSPMPPTRTSALTDATTATMIVFERRLPGLDRVVHPGSVCGLAAAR